MSSEAQYRERAVSLARLARTETNPAIKVQLHTLAASYLRLADQAKSNSQADIVYEPATHSQPMQAQQSHLKNEDEK